MSRDLSNVEVKSLGVFFALHLDPSFLLEGREVEWRLYLHNHWMHTTQIAISRERERVEPFHASVNAKNTGNVELGRQLGAGR